MKIEQLGPYRIIRELGRGGMGTVYEGVNLETDEPAAVKLLPAALAREEGFRERFESEIEALRKLNHPNIARLFGFGEQDGQLFYVMELVDGSSLEQELARGRRFNWREVSQIGIETCRALRHAHDRGIIHRDIKPANLLADCHGHVKLSDFGIARLFGNARLTGAGRVLGTAEYMAPEQAAGNPVDPRADLYSLGGVLYVLLTGRPLFRAKSLPEILQMQRFEQPDPVRRHAPDCPAGLEAIISQLLEKDPQRRPANSTILARQLEAMRRALSMDPDRVQLDAEGRDGQNEFDLTPCAAADGLPETRATSAFEDFAEAEAPDERKSAGRFTAVAQQDLDRIESRRSRTPWISAQTWALVIGLLAVGLAVWYFLRPPSADTLYERITARTADRTAASLLEAEDDVERFLRDYPADPRHGQLREYQKEIALRRLERKFELRAKGLARAEDLAPIEQAYLEAINYVRLDPDRGMAKLQALIDLYDCGPDTPGPVGDCVRLARRRLDQLREQLAGQGAQHLARVIDRLDEAKKISQTDPERAQVMYRAVIELYAEKPWAEEAVRRARDALDALAGLASGSND